MISIKHYTFKHLFRPPDGIELRPLTKLSDLKKANSNYTLRTDSSLIGLKRYLAKYNPNIGAFNHDGTLVSCILQ